MSNHAEARDTRQRIQTVALELFAEQGYDKTSLREIAERLGVTKAALYYHFRSKEEIVDSFSHDHIEMVGTLVAWAQSQPDRLATRKELLRRYADSLYRGQFSLVMRFYEHNQATLRDRPVGHRLKDCIAMMIGVLCPGQPTAVARLRASMAVFALHASLFVMRDTDYREDERFEAALTVAHELLELSDKAERREGAHGHTRAGQTPAPRRPAPTGG